LISQTGPIRAHRTQLREQHHRVHQGRVKYPSKDELREIAATAAGTHGKAAQAKHKRKTYGRKVTLKKNEQLTLV
jgi:hypothetical protein